MKKLFLFLSLFIVLNISTAYLFLFTSFGNDTLSSMIEKSLHEKGVSDFKFDSFVITTSKLDIAASMGEHSFVKIVGDIVPLALKFNLKYDIDIKDLSKLQKLTAQQYNGSFKTNGEINGNKELLLIDGVTDVFEGESKYDVVLKNFEVSNVEFLSKGLKIQKLLYTLNQPQYASGVVDIDGKVNNANLADLSGQIVTDIHDGALNNLIVNEKFDLKLTTVKLFQGQIITDLKPYVLENKIDFFTSVANLFVQKARVSLKDGSLISDYQVVFEDLSRLYDITQMKLMGKLSVDGTVIKDENMEVTGVSKTLDGEVNYRLYNDEITATLKDIEVLALTKMLTYPSFFDSNANANMTYNLVTQQGNISAKLLKGEFVKNRFSYLINTLAQFDLTKEVYENVSLNSQMDKKIINSTVNMQSQYTQIDVPKSTIDLESKTVDAKIKLDLKGNKVDAKVKGDINSPNISIDASEALKQKVKDKAKEELKRTLNKEVSDEDVDGLIKGLKSLF